MEEQRAFNNKAEYAKFLVKQYEKSIRASKEEVDSELNTIYNHIEKKSRIGESNLVYELQNKFIHQENFSRLERELKREKFKVEVDSVYKILYISWW